MSEPAAKLQVERLARGAARLVAELRRRATAEGEVWRTLERRVAHKCKALWSHLRTMTLEKFFRLLQAGEAGEQLEAPARMSPADWLLLDLLLVHDVNLALVQPVSLRSPAGLRPLVQLFHLAQLFHVEECRRERLAHAWASAALHYNKLGTQCTPMVLQRRWWELKSSTRECFYRYFARTSAGSHDMQEAGAALSGDERPAHIHVSIARRYPEIITKPLPSWQQLVAEGGVALPQEFDEIARRALRRPGEGKALPEEKEAALQVEEEEPDLILVEPPIETIEVKDEEEQEVPAELLSDESDPRQVSAPHGTEIGVALPEIKDVFSLSGWPSPSPPAPVPSPPPPPPPISAAVKSEPSEEVPCGALVDSLRVQVAREGRPHPTAAACPTIPSAACALAQAEPGGAVVSRQPEDPDTEELKAIFDEKLLLIPSVDTTRLEQMYSLRGFDLSCTLSLNAELLQAVLAESRAEQTSDCGVFRGWPAQPCDADSATRSLDLLAMMRQVEQLKKGLQVQQESEGADDAEIKQEDEDELNDVEYVPTHKAINRPAGRAYTPIALCKNPDFNTRLRRLSAGFLMLASNREYLKMCKPLTIDIISKCDAHLQPQQATRLNPPAATAAGGLLTMDITGESDEEPARTQSTALCDAVERLPGMVPPSVSAPGTAGAAAACTSADCVVIELPQTVRDAVRATTEIPVFVKHERDRPGPMRFKLSASEEPNVGWERPGPRRYKKNYTGGEGSSGDCRERGVSLEVEQGREPGEGCGRKSKPIELPDIQELRRVNRHMLTAEVSPVQARVSPFRRPDYRLQLTRSGEVVISGRAQKLRIPPVPVSRVPRAAGAGGGRGPQAAGAAAQPGWRAGARPDDQPLITSDTFYKILDSLTFNQRHLHQPGAAAAAAATAVAGAAAVAGAGEGAAAAAEASEGSSKPKGKYCCSARRHRVINDARRRMQLKRPKSSVKLELGIHRHTRELCKCCCKHLHWPSTPEPDQEATPEKELVRRAEQLVDREISEVLSVQPTTDSAAVAVAIETDQTEPQELQQLDAITQQTISTPVNMKPGIISADTSQREPIIAIDTAPSATHSRAPASSDEEAELVINLELEDTGEKKQPVDEPDKENHLKKLEMEIEELKKIINTKRIKRKYTKSSSLSENQKQQRYTEARRKRYQDLLQARREENEKMDKEVQRLQKTLDLRFGVKQKSELQRESVSPLAPMTSALVDNDAVIDLDVEEDLEAQQLDPMKQDRLNQLDKQVTELKAMISQKKAEEDAKERRQVFYRKRAQKKAAQKKVAQRRSQKKREEDTYKSEYELWLEEKRQAEKFGFKVKTTAYNPRVLPKRQSARPTPLPPRNMSYDTNAPVAHVQVDFKSNSINISVDAVEAAPTAPQSVLPPPPLVDFEGTILDAAESYILRLDEGVTPNQFASYKLLVTTANIDFGSGKETFWTLAKCGRPSIQLDLNYLETAAGDSADINTDVTSSEETSASTSAAQSTSGNKNCSGIFQQFSEEKTKISEHSVVDLVDVEPRGEARRDSTDSESNLVIVEDLPAKQVMNEQQQTQAQNEYPQELTDPCKMSVISFNKKFSTQIMIESSPEGSPVPELTEEEAPSPLDGDNTPADENVRGPPLQSDKPPVPQSLLTTYSTNPQLQTYSKPAAAGVLHPNVLISNNMRYQKISSDPLLYIQVLTPIKNVSLVNRVRDMGGELLVYHVLTGSLIPMPKAVSSFTPLGVLTHIETSESQLSQSMSVTVTGDESDANVNDCPPLSNNAINVPVFVKTAPKQNRNKRQTAVELDSNSDSDEEYRPPAYVKRKISSQDLVPVQVRSSPLKTRSLLKQTTATVSKALQPVSNSRSLLKSDLLSPENLKSATDSSRMLEEHCYTRVPEEPVWEVVAEEAPPAGDECILGM